MSNPKPTIFIDATSLKTSKCTRRFGYVVVDGYTEFEVNYKMDYGSAGHIALAHWYETKDVSTSIAKALEYYMKVNVPPGDFRNTVHLGMTLANYFTNYAIDSFTPSRCKDGSLLVEQRFAIPFYEDEHIRVVLFGVIDAIGTYGKDIVFVDHKFTASWNIDEYFSTYDLSVQMMTYKYGLTYLASQNPEGFGQFKDALCLIDGIFINKSGAKFARSHLIDITPKKLELYEELVTNVCKRLSQAYVSGYYPKDGIISAACEGEYNHPCPFVMACSIDEPELYLNTSFNKRAYGPSIFDKP